MEKSDYEEYLEFREFLRARQAANSQAIGEKATRSTQKPESRHQEDTLDYMSEVTSNYDRQGYYEGESW